MSDTTPAGKDIHQLALDVLEESGSPMSVRQLTDALNERGCKVGRLEVSALAWDMLEENDIITLTGDLLWRAVSQKQGEPNPDMLERLKVPLALIANREDRVEVDAELLLDLQAEIERLDNVLSEVRGNCATAETLHAEALAEIGDLRAQLRAITDAEPVAMVLIESGELVGSRPADGRYALAVVAPRGDTEE